MSVLDYRSPKIKTPTQLPPPPVISGHWLGWAIYLGMSWTWCIGMFLPVLIMRDFGIAGWWIFTIPNVIGAAAMGWAIRTSDRASEIARVHEPATTRFSIVTVAFHCFWLIWIVGPMIGASVLIIAPALIAGFSLLMNRVNGSAVWLACFAFTIGLVTLVLGCQRHELPYFYGVANRSGLADFAAMSAVCLFGFALCPYLDRTFLYARANTTNAQSKAAFSVGFAGFFALMLVLTLSYTGWINRVVEGSVGARPRYVWEFLAIYFIVQSAYTIAAHMSRIRQDGAPLSVARCWAAVGILVLLAGICIMLLDAAWSRHPLPHLNGGELIYRMFMAFYGLVFPTYVWLCMIPGRGQTAPTKRQLTVLWIAVLLAAPMFWMGFIETQMIWLLPGVGIVLLARLFIGQVQPRSDEYVPRTVL